ncbi:hypothetical protein ACFB49_04440 [Sphingomonas sp. DBB INV C78]|uniref:hypothetical protein n=1 Tax=Sphingomonas sp. DBB INV C78 TaxID=3349434 RepID=UPI0036D211B6
MRRSIMLLALPLFALAACEVKVGDDDKAAAGGNASAAVEKSHVSLDIPGFSAKVDIPAFDASGEDMDIDGIKLYPGSQVTGVDIKADGKDAGGKGSVRIGYVSADTPDKLQAYYEKAAKDNGFTAGPNSKDGQATVLNLTSKDSKTVQIAIEPHATGSKGALTILD